MSPNNWLWTIAHNKICLPTIWVQLLRYMRRKDRIGYKQGLIGMLQLWGTDSKSNEMSIQAMDFLYPNHSPFPWCVRFVTFSVQDSEEMWLHFSLGICQAISQFHRRICAFIQNNDKWQEGRRSLHMETWIVVACDMSNIFALGRNWR